MTFDPVTNRIPFGLLTPEEQKALKEWPHEWEFYNTERWASASSPLWSLETTYRGKTVPIVDTYYVNVYKNGITGHTYTVKKEAKFKGEGSLGMIQLEIVDGKLASVVIID